MGMHATQHSGIQVPNLPFTFTHSLLNNDWNILAKDHVMHK